jgi:hypothetical protein
MFRSFAVSAACLLTLAAAPSAAQITIPANNLGTDGSFAPFQNRTVTLGSAPTGNWEDPGDGRGIYDPEKWAVVFKYTTVSIPQNVTVNFANHPSGAPVVWLVDGDVNISGTLTLVGVNGSSDTSAYPAGGPGGFRGGKGGNPYSSGFGPGGGQAQPQGSTGEGGGFGTFGMSPVVGGIGGLVYGTSDLVPLIGGSGGGAGRATFGSSWASGGGGGGAILIVATGTITINGAIIADGGNGTSIGCGTGCSINAGGGSGGGIRLVSNTLTGSNLGVLRARGGSGPMPGGAGRIRTEANFDSLPIQSNPERSVATVGSTARLWPDASDPRIEAVTLGNQAVPQDPRGLFTFGNTDIQLSDGVPALVTINAANVPVNSYVEVRVVPVTQNQDEIRVPATFLSGSSASSTWRATLPISDGVSAFTVTVTLP